MKKFIILFSIVLLSINFAFSQILEPVKWSFQSKDLGNNEVELVITASIDNNWHLYSQIVPEGGPTKTIFYFYGMKGFEVVDKSVSIVEEKSYKREDEIDYIINFNEPVGHEENDPIFKMIVKTFEDEAIFTQKLKLTSTDPINISGYVYFGACDDKACIPPNDDSEFSFSFNDQNEAVGSETVAADKNQGQYKSTHEILADRSLILDDISNKSLWQLLIFSFIAGLAAIVTPCVFPMIPMTVSFFMKEKKSEGKREAVFFGLSIIAIYTIVGTLIAVTLGVNFANWLSTHWIPNVLFFLVFVFFAASFFGMFEIVLPSWMINKSDAKADKGGYTGAFFMAFTLVLVSFSCTGPLVGAILVKAATGEWIEPIVGMLGFSIAFALPFGIFAFFPSMMNKLPKSGGWLNSVKVVLGFIELALGLKFLSIADQTYHWGLLDREVYLALWIIIFVLMGFYLLGKIKFAHDSEMKTLGVPRLFLVIATFSFVLYLIPGMFGAPLKALSGYLPPQATHDFDLNRISRENAIAASSLELESSICEIPKYHEFLELDHGIEGYFDYEQGLACAKKLNKPIFIDFTGHGCVNCREMEASVWSDPKVLRMLKEDYVVISLYVDDKSTLDESEWVNSLADGKLKKTLGKINADLQIYNFNINAQPYYVLMGHDGDLLVKPSAYDLDVSKYVKFLDEGIENFKNGKHL